MTNLTADDQNIVKYIIIAILLVIITYLPAFMLISVLIVENPSFALAVEDNPWVPMPIIIGVTLCLAMLLIAIVGRGQFAQYGFKQTKGSDIRRALGIGFIVGTLLYISEKLAGIESAGIDQLPLLYIVLLFWIGASIQEEIIFRGLFQSHLAAHIKSVITIWNWDLPISALIGAIAFSLVHVALLSIEVTLGGVLVVVIGAFILGIIAGHFRAETGSLTGPIIVHALFNLTGTIFELFI